MAKISTYPQPTPPQLGDYVIGTDISDLLMTKNYLISDIITLATTTNQFVTIVGAQTITGSKIFDYGTTTGVYAPVIINLPAQTQAISPDGLVININGQVPTTTPGAITAINVQANFLDNICYFGTLYGNAGASKGIVIESFDAHSGNFLEFQKSLLGVLTTKFSVGNNGDATANSFIKTGGTSAQYLMADGTVSIGGTLYSAVSTTYQSSAGILQNISSAIPSSLFTSGNLLKLNAAITTTAATVAIVTIEFYINSSATTSGATLIGRYNGPIGNLYIPMDRFFWVSGTTLYGRDFTASASTSTSNSSFAINSVAIPATQFYIITQVTTTSTDRAAISTIKIERT